jgi:hypothetical protein
MKVALYVRMWAWLPNFVTEIRKALIGFQIVATEANLKILARLWPISESKKIGESTYSRLFWSYFRPMVFPGLRSRPKINLKISAHFWVKFTDGKKKAEKLISGVILGVLSAYEGEILIPEINDRQKSILRFWPDFAP